MTTETLLWVTAIATAITAVLTGTGGLAAWLTYRRERQRDNPIIERELSWVGGPHRLQLQLAIRNRLPERLVLEEVRLLAPGGMTIGPAEGPSRNVYGEAGPPEPVHTRSLSVRREVQPHGTEASRFAAGDVLWVTFALWSPPGWVSGDVRFQVRLSSKGGAISSRVMKLSCRVGRRPAPDPTPDI